MRIAVPSVAIVVIGAWTRTATLYFSLLCTGISFIAIVIDGLRTGAVDGPRRYLRSDRDSEPGLFRFQVVFWWALGIVAVGSAIAGRFSGN